MIKGLGVIINAACVVIVIISCYELSLAAQIQMNDARFAIQRYNATL